MSRRKKAKSNSATSSVASAGQASAQQGVDATCEALPYEVYREERRLLIDAEFRQADHFDVNLLYVAGGALGLSVTFTKEMVGDSLASHSSGFLVASWVFFALAILGTMSSFQTSQAAIRRQREVLDADYCGDESPATNRWAGITSRLNWSALVCFICGVVALAVFSFMNLGVEYGTRDSSSPKRGQNSQGRIRASEGNTKASTADTKDVGTKPDQKEQVGDPKQ